MDILKTFANNMKTERLKKGLSQESLACLSGLHRTYISDIERCRRNITLENLQRIADALDVKSYCLLIEEEANK